MPIKHSYYFPKWRNETQEKRISKSPAVKTYLKPDQIDNVIRTRYKPKVYFRKL